MKNQRWQDRLTSLTGLFVYFATWIIPSTLSVAYALLIIAVALFGISSLGSPHRWKQWAELVLGLCLTLSPRILDFRDAPELTRIAVTAGAIVVLSSAWVVISDRDNSLQQ